MRIGKGQTAHRTVETGAVASLISIDPLAIFPSAFCALPLTSYAKAVVASNKRVAKTMIEIAKVSARVRAFLLATSPSLRARLMLPRGVLSGVEFLVTSKYVASPSSGQRANFDKRVSRATV